MATNKKANSTEQISKPMLITIIVFAVISALLLGAAVTMAVIEEINKNYDNLDYLSDDLSQYIEFDESAYKDYDIEINVPNVSDTEVEHEILKTLASKKGSLLYDGKYVFTRPVAAGDKVYIYYRGYELDEDGKDDDGGEVVLLENGVEQEDQPAERIRENIIDQLVKTHMFSPNSILFLRGPGRSRRKSAGCNGRCARQSWRSLSLLRTGRWPRSRTGSRWGRTYRWRVCGR